LVDCVPGLEVLATDEYVASDPRIKCPANWF